MNKFLNISRYKKSLILIITDLFGLYFSLYLAFIFRFNTFSPLDYLSNNGYIICIIPFITIPLFGYIGLYNAVLKHIGQKTLALTFLAITISTLSLLIVLALYNFKIFPIKGIIGIYWFVAVFNTFFIRYFAYWFFYLKIKDKKLPLIIIYGCGEAGVMLADSIQMGKKYKLFSFVDDDPQKVNTVIKSVKVYSVDKIEKLIINYKIEMILLAMPSINRAERKNILKQISNYPIKVMELPSIENIIDGKVNVDDIRQVEAIDVLGRKAILPIDDLLHKNIKDQNVLISGAGGSIGSELCRQILILKPKKIVLYEISEYNLYSIHYELTQLNDSIEILPILGSVLHEKRIKNVLQLNNIDTVYHAAAYKHVPLVELNPCSGVYNNIIGTYTIAKQSLACNVKTFISISTDKAVRPTNIMGASKRFSEMILQMFNKNYNSTIFSMVRFGNVLDSAGSVLPLFRKQIKDGGPITVTHKEIVRYFMSIPEAVQLVIQAGAMAKGGEVFLLDMGEPVNILDMAKKMINLSGLTPKDGNHKNGDISIEITGLRPGEKLYEELLIENNSVPTKHPRIMKSEEENISMKLINQGIESFKKACKDQNSNKVVDLLKEYVKGYKPFKENY